FPKQRPVPLMYDGVPGKTRPTFRTADGVLGIAICFDYDAPEIAASLVADGATVLVDPTFDNISWGDVQHRHHELLLRLRAVETDRWILRAASSGRTEAVSPHGVPSKEGVEIGGPGFVIVDFAHRTSRTLGSRMYWLGPIAEGVTVLWLVVVGWRRFRNRLKILG
ncbi:MAG: hypothetical protein K8T89_20095, partial [Planctomycetes bacterium]|nr:hypothetical protein [Planctomycetota bacterium]